MGRCWCLRPDHGASPADPVVIDVDAILVTAHSDKEQAAPTPKRGYGFHPLCAFVDHGPTGTGESLTSQLRWGNAGSNTAADHITVLTEIFTQLPSHRPGTRSSKNVLIRIDGAGGTHDLLAWLTRRRVQYPVGFCLPHNTAQLLQRIPRSAWSPTYDAAGAIRENAYVAELTDLLDLTRWPAGMRVIVRIERPHPGARLWITDVDGNRVTAFATNARPGGKGTQLADLEVRHRRRARCEDRIRVAKAFLQERGTPSGLRNLPLHDLAQNQVWCALVMLAAKITAWTQMLASTDQPTRRWEPQRLRLRLLSVAGKVTRSGQTMTVHLAATALWARLLLAGLARLRQLHGPAPAPG